MNRPVFAPRASSQFPRRSPILWLFLISAVLQVVFLWAFQGAANHDILFTAIAAAAISPFICLLLILFPVPVLLVTPLLILVPLQLLYLHGFEIVFYAALFAYSIRYLATNPLHGPVKNTEIVFLIYLIWAAFSVTQAENVRTGLLGLKTPILFFVAYFAGSRVFEPNRVYSLLRVYALIAIGIAVETLGVGLAHGVSPTRLSRDMGPVTDLGWGRSNYVAAVASFTAAASLPLAIHTKTKQRTLALLALVCAFFVATATASRGGTIALIAGIALGLIAARKNLLWALAYVGAGTALFLFSPPGQTIFEQFMMRKGLPSIGVRLLYYRETLRIIESHPIMGVGPDQIPFHTYFYLDPNPHNILLKQAADFGSIGLLLYLFLLGLLVRNIYALRRSRDHVQVCFLALSLALSTALINAIYEPTLEGPEYGFLFWFLMGSLSAAKVSEDKSWPDHR